jgi:hypothetical protein
MNQSKSPNRSFSRWAHEYLATDVVIRLSIYKVAVKTGDKLSHNYSKKLSHNSFPMHPSTFQNEKKSVFLTITSVLVDFLYQSIFFVTLRVDYVEHQNDFKFKKV